MSANLVQLQPIFIKVDGANLDNEWFRLLEMVEVDMALGAPDMVALHFSDPDLKLCNNSTLFKHGAVVLISACNDTGQVTPISKVEIASLEPDFRGDGTDRFVARGFSKWNRLQGGRKSRTFLDQKDSDIASTIAQQAGLTIDATATAATYKYVVQWQQTDMEFLTERAERIGYELYVDDEKLTFKPAPTSGSPERTLIYAVNLARFQPRFSVTGQLNTVKVTGWDLVTKQNFVGTGTDSTQQAGLGKTGGAAAQQAFGRQVTEEIVDGTTIDQADATTVAKAIASRVNGEFFEAEGECDVAPTLRPGKIITIDKVSARFAGNYRLTGVRHVWTHEGFSTQFTVLGRNGTTLAQALSGPPARQRVDGLMVAIVTNLNDPDGLGRIKVKFPTVMSTQSSEIESFWARVATLMSGPQTGVMFYPEINDEVLVGFLDGNPATPVIVGCLWNGRDKPPLATADLQASGKIKQRMIKTKVGHEIIIDDTQGAERVQIKDKAGNLLLLDSANKLVHLKEAGGNEVKLDGQGRSVLIKSIGSLDITAQQALTIKGQSVTMESTGGDVVVKATANLTLQANANADLKANANVNVQANAMLSVKTSAILQIQGSLVKIN